MKIVFLAIPLSGHLNPQIELAKSCVGHECIFINTSSRKELIISNGFSFYPMGDEYMNVIEEFGQTPRRGGKSLFRASKAFKELGNLFDYAFHKTVQYLKDLGPDLVVVDFSTIWGGYAAESLGIPFVTTNSSPMVNDTENEWEDVPFLLGWAKGSKIKNKIGWFLIRTMQKIFQYPFPWFRWYREDGSMANYSNKKIFNLGIRELEFNQNQVTWTNWIGYPSGSKDYTNVLIPTSFDRKVLISFGTLLSDVLAKKIKPIIQKIASQYPKHLFVITYGNRELGMDLIGQDNFYEIGYLPYGLNVKKFDRVIHHGGPGIIFECIEHAIPSIVIPQAWDQFDYAQRLDYYGAAIYCRKIEQLEEVYRKMEYWDNSCLQSLAITYKNYDAGKMFNETIEKLIKEEGNK